MRTFKLSVLIALFALVIAAFAEHDRNTHVDATATQGVTPQQPIGHRALGLLSGSHGGSTSSETVKVKVTGPTIEVNSASADSSGVKVRGRYRLSTAVSDNGDPVFVKDDNVTAVDANPPIYGKNDNEESFVAGCRQVASNIIRVGCTPEIIEVYCSFHCNFTIPGKRIDCTEVNQRTIGLPKFIAQFFEEGIKELNSIGNLTTEEAVIAAFSDEQGLGSERAVQLQAAVSAKGRRSIHALAKRFPHHIALVLVILFMGFVLGFEKGTMKVPIVINKRLPVDYSLLYRVVIALMYTLAIVFFGANRIPAYAIVINSMTILVSVIMFGIDTQGTGSTKAFAALVVSIPFALGLSVMVEPWNSVIENMVILASIIGVFYCTISIFSNVKGVEFINVVYLVQVVVMLYDYGSYLFALGRMTPSVAMMQIIAGAVLPIGKSSRYTLYVTHLDTSAKRAALIFSAYYNYMDREVLYFVFGALFVFVFVTIRVGLQFARTQGHKQEYHLEDYPGYLFFYMGDLWCVVRLFNIIIGMWVYRLKPKNMKDVQLIVIDIIMVGLLFLEFTFAKDIFWLRVLASVAAVFVGRSGRFALLSDGMVMVKEDGSIRKVVSTGVGWSAYSLMGADATIDEELDGEIQQDIYLKDTLRHTTLCSKDCFGSGHKLKASGGGNFIMSYPQEGSHPGLSVQSIREVAEAVVEVTTENGFGTGLLMVNKKGEIAVITANHVLPGVGHTFQVDTSTHSQTVARTTNHSPNEVGPTADPVISVVIDKKTHYHPAKHLTWIAASEIKEIEGLVIFSIGQNVIPVTKFKVDANRGHIRIAANLKHGDSGSPVVAVIKGKLRLVGVVSAGHSDPTVGNVVVMGYGVVKAETPGQKAAPKDRSQRGPNRQPGNKPKGNQGGNADKKRNQRPPGKKVIQVISVDNAGKRLISAIDRNSSDNMDFHNRSGDYEGLESAQAELKRQKRRDNAEAVVYEFFEVFETGPSVKDRVIEAFNDARSWKHAADGIYQSANADEVTSSNEHWTNDFDWSDDE